ncbi:AAA family ATPase [Gordonia amarae]|uniref:DNA 3'-5' helicase n=2 Tax=Gordonia amarae TaxID=36821 RepID=G7GSZ8_9ACTN|nr:UvrD-helicase domain-containing protein [Gordonia amarae]MCS3880151.1 DNA helicase-2/ATP-dependent DNA helicase PcrA [Gordonia amarae]QHN18517.1 AAA family ATPase [Gordonia amarae]QHN23000.1 AAA family ATPase [Gordonia amarae]QHN31901.1 AAA family ATPase [Gordonia amarae]QHN40648.1 AAA family ATPase [Gordonia amarae]
MISAKSLAAALGLPSPTEEQVAVIEAPMEPVLVVAGAGAGKTETMASRVVWLVANQLAGPEEVLGLTFTRKAASELGARIRRRLSMLAGSPALRTWDPAGTLAARLRSTDPEVSTYHAYAGRLIADYGLLLPVEPSSTLLSETELWQLAFSVVSNWTGELDTDKTPASVTEAVLSLYSELAEHLVDVSALETAGDTLYGLIDTLPKGPRQRAEPSQALRKIQTVIDERRQMVPLVVALGDEMRRQSALDFGSQMSMAARLVRDNPEVAASERAAVRAVLLDEYQDTGHSQRILLSSLFGRRTEGVPSVAVTAVGDPIQSIYGWRGASAANLPRFTRDFRWSDGSEARRLELLTSWRNSRTALKLANETSEELRRKGIPVSVLRPREGAPPGVARVTLCDTVVDEREWVADRIEDRYRAAEEAGQAPPTAAILVRRNEDSAPLAAALAARGIPAEVVGIGGLLHVPEVADIVAMLRLVADPLAGSAAMRLLTGPRWQLGAKDIDALWRRARELAVATNYGASGVVDNREELDKALDAVLPTDLIDQAGLGDALVDPGDPDRYSPDGFARIRVFGGQLESLRRRIGQPLPELVADVEHTMGVSVEAQIQARRMRGTVTGREQLDAFAEYVSRFADRPGANLPGLLSFLDAAQSIEKGLEPGHVEVSEHRVQILTVHAAKGLEWDVVAVVHLCDRIFPGGKADSTWLGSARELPAELRGDLADTAAKGGETGTRPSESEGFPRCDVSGASDRKELETILDEHKEAIKERRLEEDRRLLYVALTRAKEELLVSAHHWSEGDEKPRGPSLFFAELLEITQTALTDPAADSEGLQVDWIVDPPADGETNPLAERDTSRPWPHDPLAGRRDVMRAAADRVLDALAHREVSGLFEVPAAAPPRTTKRGSRKRKPAEPAPVIPVAQDPVITAWRAEADALLAELRGVNQALIEVELPAHLSVSQLVELDTDEQTFAQRLRRPTPFPPNPTARRGTAFHAWVERWFGATRLLDIDELPGAADATASPDSDLDALRERFLASRWAQRTPSEVEVPFETAIGSTVIRGRIDAVFAEGEGRWLVVDWKTGAVPEPAKRTSLIVQLAAYRIAWAQLQDVPVEKVRAAFHYVRSGETLEPDDLPDREALAALLAK